MTHEEAMKTIKEMAAEKIKLLRQLADLQDRLERVTKRAENEVTLSMARTTLRRLAEEKPV